jgi:hypothetical protein
MNIETSKNIAKLVGPTLTAIVASELLNLPIWSLNTAAGVHLNGALLFLGGLAIVRAHNYWTRTWPVIITLLGWLFMFGGLGRMFVPELQLKAAENFTMVTIVSLPFFLAGIFLTIKAYGKK